MMCEELAHRTPLGSSAVKRQCSLFCLTEVSCSLEKGETNLIHGILDFNSSLPGSKEYVRVLFKKDLH